MEDWVKALKGDPRPWLLEEETPAVRHMALRVLEDRPEDDRQVKRARAAAMRADPIAAILDAQYPEGYWVKPGPGYAPKYTGTVWSVIFLDQLGADGHDKQIRRACGYVLSHSQAESGGFSSSGRREERPPPPSTVIHCLNGNLLRALIGFGWLDDPRVGFLLSRDPAEADYPMGWGNTEPSGSWFKLGFPSGYVADVLENLEVLTELGHAKDPRLGSAIDLVLSRQDAHGRWKNQHAYNGKTWVNVEEQGRPSKWVTLRACRVLRSALS